MLDVMTAVELACDEELGPYFRTRQAVYAAARRLGLPYVDAGKMVFERRAVHAWLDGRRHGDVLSAKARSKVLLAENR